MSEIGFGCIECGLTYAWDDLKFCCDCGGLFELLFERPEFDTSLIRTETLSLLRYRDFFPKCLHDALQEISLGEGWTPTVPSLLSQNTPHLHIKMDHLTPTHSFKDRGAIMLIAQARAIEAKKIIQDSSGNAGHAIAVYAARAQIPCEIYLPANTSPKKIDLVEATGAKVHRVQGSREDTAAAAFVAACEPGVFYASHVYNPLFYEGTKTYAYELFEQLGQLPDRLVLPLGNGTLVLGVLQACQELESTGSQVDPVEIVAVQAANCAPIARAFQTEQQTVKAVENQGTVAKGIAIAKPARGNQILDALRESNCRTIAASEPEIKITKELLAVHGLDVEATTAASFSVLLGNPDFDARTTVIPICGSGVKR